MEAPGFPVVAVIAELGAEQELAQFFGAMAPPTGAAFVVIDRTRPSRGWTSVDILRAASFDVIVATERTPLTRDRVHLVPRDRRVVFVSDTVYPVETKEAGSAADLLLRSLADENGEFAIAVMLGDAQDPQAARAIEDGGGLAAADREAGGVFQLVAPARELALHVHDYAQRLVEERHAARPAARPRNVEAVAARVLPKDPAMPSVLVDRRGEILYVNGHTGDYLEPSPGYANWNVYAMARPGLRDALIFALPEAFRSGAKVVRPRLAVDVDHAVRVVDLVVKRVDDSGWEEEAAVVGFVKARRPRSRMAVRRRGR